MRGISEFEDVFENVDGDGYDDALHHAITGNRRGLGNKLFFDRLLELLKIKVGKLYPPRSQQDLRELHKRITEARIDTHNKCCLLFYLLKDLSQSSQGTSEPANDFALAVHLPEKYWTFLEGLWHLDHREYDRAVENLTHPSLIPTFPDEILQMLLKQESSGWKLANGDDNGLSLAYYQAVQPPLNDDTVRDKFAEYLADRKVTETFDWIRSRPDYEQRHLFEILISRVLGQFLDRQGQLGQLRAERASELVGLALNGEEEAWFEDFLSEGEGRNLPAAHKTLVVRQVATGKIKGAVREGIVRDSGKHGAATWERVERGLENGLGPRLHDDTPFMV